MATHSSVLAWRIPGMGSLVGCRLWGRTESDTTEVTSQQQQQEDVFTFLPDKELYPEYIEKLTGKKKRKLKQVI